MMFLLDTDTLSHLMYGRAQVVDRIRAATRPVVCTIVSRLEILRGRFQAVFAAEDGAKVLEAQERLNQTEAFFASLQWLPLDSGSMVEFDRLRLAGKLKKIGRGDLLIASVALSHRATLVTRNRKDFGLVPGLATENWVD